jgi:hypothetical protein
MTTFRDVPGKWREERGLLNDMAFNILSAMLAEDTDYSQMPLIMVQWYHRKRLLDLVLNDEGADGTTLDRNRIAADIRALERALQEHPDARAAASSTDG